MNRPCAARWRLRTAWLAVALAGGASAAGVEEPAIEIPRGDVQLFVDDFLIETKAGLKRTLHSPKKENNGDFPLIAAEPGTTLLAYGSIVFDEKLKRYVMFIQHFPTREMLRLTSRDGLKWNEETGGKPEPIRFAPDVQPEAGARGRPGYDLFSCYYDRKDAKWPYKGWMYYANCGDEREGIYYVRSEDGRQWEVGRQVVNAFAGDTDTSCRRIEQDGKTVYGPGDVTLFSYDPIDDRFLGLFKFFTTEKLPHGSSLRSRAYLFVDRLDEPVDLARFERIALLPPLAEKNGDMPWDEFYASTAWRYGRLWLGGLKVYHGEGDYPWSAPGCAFLKLIVSRDGLNWKKVRFANEAGQPEVFLANGKEGGNDERNDGGYISEFSQGPLRIGDELVYYYSASSLGKKQPPERVIRGGGIFRARLRVDGFVSVEGGTLTTKPLKPAGNELSVNAVGPVQVDVLDLAGSALARAEVKGDSIDHRVRFDGKTLGEVSADKPVRLRFTVGEGGRLYSFTVR